MEPETMAMILNVRSDSIEQRIKVECQDLLISRLKSEVEFLRSANQTLEAKVSKCHANEVAGAGVKRELEIIREQVSAKDKEIQRLAQVNDDLTSKLDTESSKRKRLRRCHKTLNGYIGEGCDAEAQHALDLMMENLKN